MADEQHAATRLLLKRMESHPEEFMRGADRWGSFIEDIFEYGHEFDKAAINGGLRNIRLGEVHEWIMDELLNGEQRRAKERQVSEAEALLRQYRQIQSAGTVNQSIVESAMQQSKKMPGAW